METQIKMHKTLVRLVYTDKCCTDVDFYNEVIPSLREDLIHAPNLELQQQPVVITSFSDAQLHSAHIYSYLNALGPGDRVIGLDTEWDVSSEKAPDGTVHYKEKISKVALLQIAVPQGIDSL